MYFFVHTFCISKIIKIVTIRGRSHMTSLPRGGGREKGFQNDDD